MDIAQLISQIGSDVGLEGLELDSNDACALVFDQKFQIDLSYRQQDRTLHLSSLVGSVQRSKKAELFGTMLAANGTPDSPLAPLHFALEPASETVALCTMLSEEDQTLEAVSHSIAQLLKNCQDWRVQLGDAGLLATIN